MSEHGLRVSNFVAGALMSIPKCIPEFLSVSLASLQLITFIVKV